MNWIDHNTALFYIPKIIIDAKTYSDSQQPNMLTLYSFEPKFTKALLFYVQLFQLPMIPINYDFFNFIPLSRNEIVGLTVYANNLETLMTDRITLNSYCVKYTL